MKRSFGADTLLFPTPVLVVGTYDAEGRPNLMTVAWGGIVCSDPPAVSVCVRKATHTYANLIQKKAFTVCIAHQSRVKEVDYIGIVSGKREDKFEVLGLTAVHGDKVDAPYVQEYPIALECELLRPPMELGLHTQFIGKVLDAKVEEDMLDSEGKPDLTLLRPILYAPRVRGYFGVGESLGKAFSIGKELIKKVAE